MQTSPTRPRWHQVAAVTCIYLLIVAATIWVILAGRPQSTDPPQNIAPMLGTVHAHYTSTMSSLAVHTTLFNDQSSRLATEDYHALASATEAFGRRLADTPLRDAEVRRRLVELMREIALARPVVERIGASLIDASLGFSALYGLESDILALIAELERLHNEGLSAISEAERAFTIKVTLLLLGTMIFAGFTVAMFWRDFARLRQSYEELARRSDALQTAKRRAEAASEAKSRFLATMSHEMRTPMHGVIGLSQLLLRESLGQRERLFAGKIYESAAALIQIINEVLDMSAIESGALRVEPRTFSLEEVLGEAAAPFEAMAQQKGLEFLVTVAPGVEERLHGDDQRLRQILQNLIGNAVKFTEEGRITLAVTATDSGCLRFAVSDTGIGIPTEELGRVFERFHQVDNTETRTRGGTGLGLAISRELALLMGGQITVSSTCGEGSTFAVTLPLSPAREAPAATPAELRCSA